MEYLSGVESNFGAAKILITPADSVYLTFSKSGMFFFELTSGKGINLKYLVVLHIFSMFRARMCIRYPRFGLSGYFIPINRKLFLDLRPPE